MDEECFSLDFDWISDRGLALLGTASVLVDRITEHSLLTVKDNIKFTSNMTRLDGLKLLLVEDNTINQIAQISMAIV